MRPAPRKLVPPLLAGLLALLLVVPSTAAAGTRTEGKAQGAGRIGLSAGMAVAEPRRSLLASLPRCHRRAFALRRNEVRRAARRTLALTATRRRGSDPERARLARLRRALRRVRGACARQVPERPRPATDSSAQGGPLYWGAWIGDQLTGDQAPWDHSAMDSFEELAGKSMSLLHFASPFADCSSSGCHYYDFPTGPMEDIRERGAIPFFSWSSQATPAKLSQPDYQLSDVLEGDHDAYIREFAEAAREWGHPFFLRFNWEMNGDWFAWSERANGNDAGESVAAWRYVHDMFEEVGADNVTWVWCPNIDPAGEMQDLEELYPGDDYVDWTGLDGYNWSRGSEQSGNSDAWRGFEELYRSTYEEIVDDVAPDKPMAIGEFASTEHGGSKAEWIRDALSTIPSRFPQIRAVLWFEKYDDGMDWPIETSPEAIDAFADGIGDSAYVGGEFGDIGPGAIEPPN